MLKLHVVGSDERGIYYIEYWIYYSLQDKDLKHQEELEKLAQEIEAKEEAMNEKDSKFLEEKERLKEELAEAQNVSEIWFPCEISSGWFIFIWRSGFCCWESFTLLDLLTKISCPT